MSTKGLDHWEDEAEDEEEEDFVPEDYDDEEGDDSVDHQDDDDDDDDDDPEDFPSILQGEIFMDKTKVLCFEQEGFFRLVCKTSTPEWTFAFEAPVIDNPLVFGGWIKDPNHWMEFEVLFSKELMSKDPLQIQLMEAQEQKQLSNGSLTRTKTDNYDIDDNLMEKKSPPKGNLKTPPLYSLKEISGIDTTVRNCSPLNSTAGISVETDQGKMRRHELSKRTKTSDVTEKDMKSTVQNDMMFVVSGSQIGNDTKNSLSISFRGAYRCPSKASVERLHLICPIQTFDGTASTSVAGGTASVAAASQKRNRSRSGDDNSVEENIGVAYQELIDLHDDTRLSTEELRKRYYGRGDNKGECGKKHGADNKRLKGSNDRNYQKNDVNEDDDDDAYGF